MVLPSGTRGLPSANRNSRGSLTDLDALVQSYQLMALTDNTARVYSQGGRGFFNFCMHYNLPVRGATPNRIDEQTLLYFAAHCAHHMKSTTNLYLYGLCNWCAGLGFPNPLKTEYGGPLLRLDRVLKGIKKLHKGHNRPRLPITIDILQMIVSFLSLGCFGIFEDLMMSAAVTFAFSGFLHCG